MSTPKPTSGTAAIILIDHQVGTLNFAKSLPRHLIEANTRALARTAIALRIPMVFTSSMEQYQQGPLLPALETIAPEAFALRVKREGVVNCWDDIHFAEACRRTGRTHLIMAGVTTDVCLAPPAISAVAQGYVVTAVVDASGSPTALTDDMAFRRMERGGVALTTTTALLSELAHSWASADGQKIMQILGDEILNHD